MQGGERQGWGHLCPPIPFPGDKSRSLSTATVEQSLAPESSHSLPYQTPGFPVQGRGRREKKGQGSKWHSKTFFNEKTFGIEVGELP